MIPSIITPKSSNQDWLHWENVEKSSLTFDHVDTPLNEYLNLDLYLGVT